MMIQFVVPGKPVPKGRPRVMRNGHTFTPKRTKDYETLVAVWALNAISGIHWLLLKGPLSIRIEFYGCDGRSDWDNLAKAICDALNGVIYIDDCQIVHAIVIKHWAEKGTERTSVRIEELKAGKS